MQLLLTLQHYYRVSLFPNNYSDTTTVKVAFVVFRPTPLKMHFRCMYLVNLSKYRMTYESGAILVVTVTVVLGGSCMSLQITINMIIQVTRPSESPLLRARSFTQNISSLFVHGSYGYLKTSIKCFNLL